MNEIADKNTTNLKVENERVNKNLRNCCNCWIYLLVGIVFIPTTKSYQDVNSSSLNTPFKNEF